MLWRSVTLGLVAALFATTVDAQVRVRGYYRSDGTYVAPHYRSSPNSTTSDNYSTVGNVNPYTGEPGTKADTRPGGSVAPTQVNPPVALIAPAPVLAAGPTPQTKAMATNWLPLDDSPDGQVFTKPPYAYQFWRRIWARFDHKSDGHTSISLYNVDCSAQKVAEIQWTRYVDASMSKATGEKTLGDYQATWSFPVPGTVLAEIMRRACA